MSVDALEEEVRHFLAFVHRETGRMPRRLDMTIGFEDGGSGLRVTRTPIDDGGTGEVEVGFVSE